MGNYSNTSWETLAKMRTEWKGSGGRRRKIKGMASGGIYQRCCRIKLIQFPFLQREPANTKLSISDSRETSGPCIVELEVSRRRCRHRVASGPEKDR